MEPFNSPTSTNSEKKQGESIEEKGLNKLIDNNFI
jgi:hypothetical protein